MQTIETKRGFGFMYIIILIFLMFPINVLAYYKIEVLPMIFNGSFPILISLSKLWSFIVLIDFILMPIIIMLSFVIIVLFFKRSKYVPKLITLTLIGYLILLLIDLAANNFLSNYANGEYLSAVNDRILKSIFRTFLYILVTIPYLFISKKTKEIFIR
ncbi:DUF2569 family protein [Chengkuizengella sediminis]|uniref:DUF2569 family protein n=1 Tax=Chengkuizengella sediminis TaxID=1885917 RepID=UPI00138A6C27|nr:DUF2569 family protein [Chengkuizengella sediminis]NDI36238.1 DUF2569 family protein [Chengkuizengella sediminis]